MDTEVCKFYKMVNEKGKMSVSEAAKLLKVAEDVVEGWAKTLDSANLVTLDYPLNPLESPVVRKKEVLKKDKTVPKAQKKKEEKPVKKRRKPRKKKDGGKVQRLTKHVWRK